MSLSLQIVRNGEISVRDAQEKGRVKSVRLAVRKVFADSLCGSVTVTGPPAFQKIVEKKVASPPSAKEIDFVEKMVRRHRRGCFL